MAARDQSHLKLVTDAFVAQRATGFKFGSGDGTSGGMDGWQTSVEARLGEIKDDIRDLRTDIGGVRSDLTTVKVNLATLTERVAHLPTKGFFVTALVASLAVITAIVAFQGQIQAFLKLH